MGLEYSIEMTDTTRNRLGCSVEMADDQYGRLQQSELE